MHGGTGGELRPQLSIPGLSAGLRETRTYSRLLIRLAWAVEVVAVLIGLTISVVVAFGAYDSIDNKAQAGLLGNSATILVASLPFVLIALVEICKIPLTFAFLAVSNYFWKLLLLGFVLFLCLITFETMFNGFERNFSNLNRAIDERNNEIARLERQRDLLAQRREYVVRFTEEDVRAEVEREMALHQREFLAGVSKTNQRSVQAMAGIDRSFPEEIAAERLRLETLRDEYYAQWGTETGAVEARFASLTTDNLRGSAAERERLLGELMTLREEMADAMARTNFFTRATVENKYRGLVTRKEDQLATITTGYLGADAINKMADMEAELKAQLDFVNSKYSGRVEGTNQRLAALKQDLANRHDEVAQMEQRIQQDAANQRVQLARLRDANAAKLDSYLQDKLVEHDAFMQRAFGIDEEALQIGSQQADLQAEINQLINQNQVYRLAMYAFGRASAEQVGRSEVALVGFIWFGSLSLIAAVCGVMLALAGFYLRRFVEEVRLPDS
ncbi:MAG: hypothetical protein AAF993_04700 [Pseudomonadota bacterium]